MIDGKPYKPYRYRQLVEKNMVITLLSEHSISLTDIDNMPILDRDFIYDKLVERQEHLKEKLTERNANRNKNKYR